MSASTKSHLTQFDLCDARCQLALENKMVSNWASESEGWVQTLAWLEGSGKIVSNALIRRLVTQLRGDLVPLPLTITTNELVDRLAYHWRCSQTTASSTTENLHYDAWKPEFDQLCATASAQNLLPGPIASSLPVREDVAKLVFGVLTGRMPFSREYVLRHYERQYRNKPYLYFPSNSGQVKRLIILFSGHVGRKTYNRYSWYWDETEQWHGETARLFLSDEHSHWYVGASGEDDRSIWQELILNTISSLNISSSQVFTLGASMGGYGAIHYAIRLGLKAAIAVNAQLSFQSAMRSKDESWEHRIRECGANFIDVPDMIFRHDRRPILYIEHGLSACDVCGIHETLQAIRSKCGMVIERTVDSHSHQSDNPQRHHIESLISFIESF